MIELGKRRVALIAVLIVLVVGGAWLALDAGARHGAHDLYHGALVALNLASGDVEGATYWCPMHPEIRRQAPGTCPI